MNDNKIYHNVYDFCRCSRVGDTFKIIHDHKGCSRDQRELIAIRKENNFFRIIMDSDKGQLIGKNINRSNFDDNHTFQKLYNE